MKKILCLALLSASILGASELESKCNRDNLGACVDLGLEYANNKNYEKARDFWIKACNGGYAKSCFGLGNLYQYKDKSKEKAYYTKACNGKYGEGCYNLGEMYEEGWVGKKPDYIKAREFYAKACDVKYAGGCYKLRELYQYGYGVKKDLSKAKKYFKKSCDLAPNEIPNGCGEYKSIIE